MNENMGLNVLGRQPDILETNCKKLLTPSLEKRLE